MFEYVSIRYSCTVSTTLTTITMVRIFTLAEVRSHSTDDDLYMIIHGKVYDATSFGDEHP